MAYAGTVRQPHTIDLFEWWIMNMKMNRRNGRCISGSLIIVQYDNLIAKEWFFVHSILLEKKWYPQSIFEERAGDLTDISFVFKIIIT